MKITFIHSAIILAFIISISCSKKDKSEKLEIFLNEKRPEVVKKVETINFYVYGNPSFYRDTLLIEEYSSDGITKKSIEYEYYSKIYYFEGTPFRYLKSTTIFDYDSFGRKNSGVKTFSKKYTREWAIQDNAYNYYEYNYPHKDTIIEFESRFNRYQGDNLKFHRIYSKTYDSDNKLVEEKEYNSFNDRYEKVTKYVNDNNGQGFSKIVYDKMGSVSSVSEYKYDNLGRVFECYMILNPSGEKVFREYHYNKSGLLEKIIEKNHTQQPVYEIEYHYFTEYIVTCDVFPTPINGFEAIKENLVFPQQAKDQNIRGVVYVLAYIDEFGTVIYVDVAKKVGFGFDEAAMLAVKKTMFNPGIKNGIPVKSKVTIPVKI